MSLNDPREKELLACGILSLQDAETGALFQVDTQDARTRSDYAQTNQQRVAAREKLFQSVGMDYIDLSTDTPYADGSIKFFLKRRRRKGSGR